MLDILVIQEFNLPVGFFCASLKCLSYSVRVSCFPPCASLNIYFTQFEYLDGVRAYSLLKG